MLAAGESVGGSALPESGPRIHTRRHMEEDTEEKIGAWRHVDPKLMPGFLSMGRLGPDALDGGVVG